jgi:DNA-binding XRE family transcriptional regulator
VKITTDHAASSYGTPVILDDRGRVLDYALGVRAVRRALGLSTAELGEALGCSRRTVENWEQSRNTPEVPTLYRLAELLESGVKR